MTIFDKQFIGIVAWPSSNSKLCIWLSGWAVTERTKKKCCANNVKDVKSGTIFHAIYAGQTNYRFKRWRYRGTIVQRSCFSQRRRNGSNLLATCFSLLLCLPVLEQGERRFVFKISTITIIIIINMLMYPPDDFAEVGGGVEVHWWGQCMVWS